MSTFVVVAVYLAAIAIPVALLYFFHARAWYWHVLSLVAALALGFMPTPPGWDTYTMSLVMGFAFALLMIWGLGGLVLYRSHTKTEKHA